MNAPAAADARTRSWNAAMSASPGTLDLDVPAASVEGRVPDVLRGGRLLSNGPGWTRIGDVTAHPFDGHGYVRSFEFGADGGVRLRARFVGTPSYVEESRAQRFVRRGLATNVPGGPFRNLTLGPPRNVANTTILRFGDRLLAGWEGGAPFALDPVTLDTRGEETFGGAIAGQATLAHFHRGPGDGTLVSCSIVSFPKPVLTFREFDASGALVRTRVAKPAAPLFLHDFAVTPDWYVVGSNPIRLQPGRLVKMLAGFGTLLESIEPEPARAPVLYLVPRHGDGPVRAVQLPGPAFVVHFANAFERDGAVHVDACAFGSFNFGQEFGYSGPRAPFDPRHPDARGPQRLLRITVPDGATAATWRTLAPHGVDFPRIHPDHEGRDTRALFGATRADTRFSDPFDSVLRVDLRDADRPPDLFTVPPDSFVGEPVFVPDPGDDAKGFVLVLVSDGNDARTRLVVLDAARLSAGPLASVPLPLLPVAFHGDWDARGARA